MIPKDINQLFASFKESHPEDSDKINLARAILADNRNNKSSRMLTLKEGLDLAAQYLDN